MQTCQSVSFICTLSTEGVVALLQAEGLVHLPSVFYSGCQKWGGGNRAGHVIHSCAFWLRIWDGQVRHCDTRVFKMNEYEIKSVSSQ